MVLSFLLILFNFDSSLIDFLDNQYPPTSKRSNELYMIVVLEPINCPNIPPSSAPNGASRVEIPIIDPIAIPS